MVKLHNGKVTFCKDIKIALHVHVYWKVAVAMVQTIVLIFFSCFFHIA